MVLRPSSPCALVALAPKHVQRTSVATPLPRSADACAQSPRLSWAALPCRTCPFQVTYSPCATSAFAPTSMPARRQSANASSSTPAKNTPLARFTTAPPRWTTWRRSRSGASPSRQRRHRFAGGNTPSIWLTRRAMWTSRPKSSAPCASSMGRSSSLTACMVWRRSRKRFGDRRIATASRASVSSTRWTGRGPTTTPPWRLSSPGWEPRWCR